MQCKLQIYQSYTLAITRHNATFNVTIDSELKGKNAIYYLVPITNSSTWH